MSLLVHSKINIIEVLTMPLIQFGSSSPAASEAKLLRQQSKQQTKLLKELLQHVEDKEVLVELRNTVAANQKQIEQAKKELGLA